MSSGWVAASPIIAEPINTMPQLLKLIDVGGILIPTNQDEGF